MVVVVVVGVITDFLLSTLGPIIPTSIKLEDCCGLLKKNMEIKLAGPIS
jgi:hypothetical protein